MWWYKCLLHQASIRNSSTTVIQGGGREGGKRGSDKLLPNMKEKNIQNICLRTIFLVNV